jgi:CxxC motif-containing protein (DUF1111 family)
MSFLNSLHESRNPKLTVHQKGNLPSAWRKASDNSGHQVSDDDKIADCDSEALDGNGAIEEDREVRICHLRKRREGHMPTVNVSRASRLQVQPEACRGAGPCDNKDSEEDAHLGEGRGHGEEAGSENWSCLATACALRVSR